MTKAELYDAARLRVRKTETDDLDKDVQRLVDTALTDIERIGVNNTWTNDVSDPLIIETVLSFVRANYSIDTAMYPVLIQIYNANLIKLQGNSIYFAEKA